MSDAVNKIALVPFYVPMETGLTMGWGSQKHSSIKNVLSKSFSPNDLSQYLQSAFVMILEGKASKFTVRGLVNENEPNLLRAYGLDKTIQTSAVNILMKFISHKLVHL